MFNGVMVKKNFFNEHIHFQKNVSITFLIQFNSIQQKFTQNAYKNMCIYYYKTIRSKMLIAVA